MTQQPGQATNESCLPEAEELASGGDAGLTPRQRQGLLALVGHPSVSDAARASGISERTLYRWLAQPVFRERLEAERELAFRRVAKKIPKLANRAVASLDRVLLDEALPAETRIAAARTVLDLAAQLLMGSK